ncbi:gibberellin receptor GID1B-like [Arachis stenosperma]|uniref:gibberellin receptor GID1B-like n=1 Tax=Arachis stenosperma TaxID=217475 RepID=UPI0025AC0A57|nr:gibberellin receptor GID1B-like [Arachis stenosperma]
MAGSNEVNLNESRSVVPLNTWVLISNFKLAYNLLRRADGTFNRELAEFLDRKVPSNSIPVHGVWSFDHIDQRTPGLFYRLYLQDSHQRGCATAATVIPDMDKPLSTTDIVPVIIFFHGGSFSHSSANSAIYDTFCRRLVNVSNSVVVSVNYRRSPEYRFPCAYEDGWTALEWVRSRKWLRSGRSESESESESKVYVYMAGDSSGGNIVHHVAVRAAEEGIEVLGNILLHPLFGGEKRTESEIRLDGKYFVKLQDRDWYWRAFLPEGEDRDHPACNPFGPRGRSLKGLSSFPKTLVCVAGLDLLQDWQLAYANSLRSFSHHVNLLYLKDATIGFYFLPNNDHFSSLMDQINNFVNPNC